MEAHVAETGAFLAFILTALRLATPLSFAALGGYCSERSGTINIALEGMMLMGAFTAAATAHATHSAAAGLAAGMAGAALLAALHGLLCIRFGADQIISGMAVNFLAIGVPPVASKALYDMSGGTPMLAAGERVPHIAGLSPLLLLAVVCTVALWAAHRHSRLGQYLRFAGEHPEALQSQGISVARVRWAGVLLAGVLCGLAGAYLSIDHGGGFARNMTAGRGYIALAALIIGRWTPVGAAVAALVFGAVEASQILLQGASLGESHTVPVQWIQMIPYIATLAILAGLAGGRFGRTRPPSALGMPLNQ
jgi:simple sugar transport system permease protein